MIDLEVDIDPRIYERAPWGHKTDFVFFAKAGSHAHGTVLPKDNPHDIDDVDYLGIILPPGDMLLGLDHFEHWVERWDELDVTCYSLEKVVRLWLKANPNVLGLLWLPDAHVVWSSEVFELFKAERDIFLARDPVYNAFVGYARAQLKKMTSGQLYQGYMGEKRRSLVDEFGYDTKNAAHLIRLLHMAIEFLERGEVIVDRTGIDAEELKKIKRGEYTLEEIKTAADLLFDRAKEAREYSQLPLKANRERANELLVAAHRKWLT